MGSQRGKTILPCVPCVVVQLKILSFLSKARKGVKRPYDAAAAPFTLRLVILGGEVINEMAQGETNPSVPGGLIDKSQSVYHQ